MKIVWAGLNLGLSDEEIDQMVKDAEANAAEDKKFEELIAARNTADGMIHATKKTLEEAGDKASDEEKDAINAAITELEEAVKGDDIADMEAKTKVLTDASGNLAQKMYAEAQAAEEGAAGAAEEGGSDENAEAVDAEFEEVSEEEKDEEKEEK